MKYLPISNLKKGGNIWGVEFLDWRKSYVTQNDNKTCLAVVYKQGSDSDKNLENGGIELVFSPPKVLPSSSMASFGCKVKYPDTFDFTRGGKTGVGFSIGTGAASGGNRSENSSTARIVWRGEGSASLYVYTPKDLYQLNPELDKSARKEGWGVEFFLDVFKQGTLLRGKWNDLSIKVVLNTFAGDGTPNFDGICIVTINGKAASVGGISWLRSPDVISKIPFHTFFGGDWCASKDETVLYSDFWVDS